MDERLAVKLVGLGEAEDEHRGWICPEQGRVVWTICQALEISYADDLQRHIGIAHTVTFTLTSRGKSTKASQIPDKKGKLTTNRNGVKRLYYLVTCGFEILLLSRRTQSRHIVRHIFSARKARKVKQAAV